MTEQQAAETHADFELMDREDEEQILAELRGVPVDKFIYKNSRGQYELSYAGTKWAVREMANRGEAIRIDGHPKVERCVIDPEYITVTVLAKRVKVDRESHVETVLDTTIGSARGWIKQKLQDGRVISDDFFYSKSVSKAVRNSQQALMAQDFKREMIEALKVMQAGGAAPTARSRGPGRPPGSTNKAAPPVQKTSPAQPAPGAAPGAAPAPAQGAPQAAPAQKPAAPAQSSNKPPGAAPAAPPGAQKPAAPPAAAPAKPAAAPARPTAPNTTRPAPAQSPKDAAMDVLFQRFEVVLKQASGFTQDRPKMLGFLKQLTGKESVTAMSREEIQELGPILNGISKGGSRFENGTIYDNVTGEVLWPRQPEQAELPVEPQVEAPPEEVPAEEPMF